MNVTRRPYGRRWLDAARHLSWPDSARMMLLLLLPWVVALVLVRSHHHLDVGGWTFVLTASLGLSTLYVTWAANRDSRRSGEEQGKQLDQAVASSSRTQTLHERFATAAKQLGSKKSAVRLAAVYAMAGLADDWPENRQTIVDVICAYLRMPFSATAPISKPETEAAEAAGERGAQPETATDGNGDAWRQERQVRLTAQRILAEHLRDDRAKDQRSTEHPSPRFWPDIRLDLVGATLIDFDLGDGVTPDADFRGATFSGAARFSGTTFNGEAWFSEATFSDDAWFIEATFSSDAKFDRTSFGGGASFGEATFSSIADFDAANFSRRGGFGGASFSGFAGFSGTTFNGEAWFSEATFSDAAQFDRASFIGDAQFEEANFSGAGFAEVTFSGNAKFNEATFKGDVEFDKAAFSSDAEFGRTSFSHNARFEGTTFSGNAKFGRASFSGDAVFDRATFSSNAGFGATFGRNARFDRATFSGSAVFRGATFSTGEPNWSFQGSRVLSPDAEHVWPTGWSLGPDGSGGYTVV